MCLPPACFHHSCYSVVPLMASMLSISGGRSLIGKAQSEAGVIAAQTRDYHHTVTFALTWAHTAAYLNQDGFGNRVFWVCILKKKTFALIYHLQIEDEIAV